MANFCKKCGKEINLESGFCPYCGETIGQTTTTNQMNSNISNQATGKNDNTVLAFVLSLLGFVCCTYLAIPGLIMSILSLQNINKGELPPKNKGLAIAGIILGALGILVMINNIINPNSAVTDLVNEMMNG